MFLECVPVGELEANCYILCDEETKIGAVIDPGVYTEEVKSAIKRSGMTELKYILCTHGHFDHICGVANLKKDYPDAKVCIGKEDAQYLENGRLAMASIFKAAFKDCPADITFSHGDMFAIGDAMVEVYASPGHTPGGVLYVFHGERCIFTGDTLFRESVGSPRFKGGNARVLLNTLRGMRDFPDDYVIFAGHGESSTIGHERRNNVYLK